MIVFTVLSSNGVMLHVGYMEGASDPSSGQEADLLGKL